jgi:hypothetical protein
MFSFEGKKNIETECDEDYYHDINIIYTDDNLSLRMSPEQENAIDSYVPGNNLFHYNSDCNGGIEIIMDNEKIILSVAKYGNGEGGHIEIIITNKQSIKSFINVLNQWQNFISN